ncbi:nuclear pore complex protein Nup205-like [Ostrinia nubilalis]|uniref:nuclear pore complex protein Nup205-like n=1 Tax=Ostrinia nubilalis TaxID=29057 RepID=UPI00308239FB
MRTRLYARDPLGLRHEYWAAAADRPPPHSDVAQCCNNTRTRLDALLRCVERLYARDPLGLRHEYWAAAADRPPPHRAATRAATLYKFVRLSGELVCAALLPAYLRALAALAVPVHTWALLARRDALSAHHLLTALARYYTNLRVDPTPFSEHQHSSMGATAIVTPAARPGKLLVRQEEVEAMIAALKLIAAVAIQDEAACASICENLQWDAVNVMFGLICCHVPIQLKAELCLTLGALGSTASTAPRVWCALESAQLVSPTDEKRALTADLQEVECRMEDYPLSRAFVSLLLSLCRAGGLPRALGAGTRAPGLAPYAHHVLARLALPAPHRPHADPARRWQVQRARCIASQVAWSLAPYAHHVLARLALPAPHRPHADPARRWQV